MLRSNALIITALALGACGSTAPRTASTPPPASPSPQATATDATSVEVEGDLLAPMPTAVTSFGAATDGTHLYVLGGYHGTPHSYSREGQSRSLWRLPLAGEGRWEEIARMDEGLQGLALVARGDRLCQIGGNTIENEEGEPAVMRSVASAACWSGSGWEALPALPDGRSSHQAVVAGDTLYVAGGWKLEGDASTGTFHRSMLALDPGASAWRTIEAPFTRRALGLASASGQIVAVGGLGEDRQPSGRVDVYDPATGTWTRGPEYPSDAFGIAAVGVGDSVLASARDGVVYRWRVGAPAWERAATLAFPRFFHMLVPSDGGLVAVGGISGMHTHGRTAHVERVALDATDPSLALFTMPFPGSTKNRQSVFLHDDFLYLFGGNDSLGQHDFAPENFQSEGWRVHLPSMRWERIADYPARRQSMQTVVVGEQAISVGGFGHDGAAAVSHPEAYTFDFARGTWEERAGLPSGRTQFGLTALGDHLYVLGGLDYDPSRSGESAFDHVTSILRAPVDDTSTGFAPVEGLAMPGPRRAFAHAELGGRIYIVSGMREGFQLVEDCLALDVEAQRFAPIACPARTRLSAELVTLGDRLYLAAGSVRGEGENGMQSDRSIEVYDPSADRWAPVLSELPFDTRHARMLAYRDRLLIVSTHRDDGRMLVALVRP